MLVHCTPPPPQKKGFPDSPLTLTSSLCTWLERCTVRVSVLPNKYLATSLTQHLANNQLSNYINKLPNRSTHLDQLTEINSLVYQSYWQVDNDKMIRSVGELTTLKGVYELTNSVCKLVVGELTCQQSDRLQPKKTTQLLNCGRP